MRHNCAACCFFRLARTKGGYRRRVCMFTGEKRPYIGMDGCNFIAGAWSQLDAILDLPKSGDCGNSGLPNTVKLGNSFSKTGEIVAKTKIAIDDFSVNPISHIAAKKLEGSLVRPEYREVPVAHSARERTGCLFTFNPNTVRQTCLIPSA